MQAIVEQAFYRLQAQQAAEANLQTATSSLTEQHQIASAQHAQQAQQAQQLMSQVQQLETTCARLTGSGLAAEQASSDAARRAEASGEQYAWISIVYSFVADLRLWYRFVSHRAAMLAILMKPHQSHLRAASAINGAPSPPRPPCLELSNHKLVVAHRD